MILEIASVSDATSNWRKFLIVGGGQQDINARLECNCHPSFPPDPLSISCHTSCFKACLSSSFTAANSIPSRRPVGRTKLHGRDMCGRILRSREGSVPEDMCIQYAVLNTHGGSAGQSDETQSHWWRLEVGLQSPPRSNVGGGV